METLELDVALENLRKRDAALATIGGCWRFFAGLSFDDIAEELGCHERTVRRDWELARSFLRKAIDRSRAQ